jgi:hypothetical protein
MAKTDDYDQREDPGWFRDELRGRDRVISELRSELDEANDLLRKFSDHADDYNTTLENWRETFDMVLTDEGWSWAPFWDKHNDLVDRYNNLVRRWNKVIPLIDGPQDVGRPLAASEAQVAEVLRLQKAGKSLREIAFYTSLGLGTVRTIIGRNNGTDRTSKKRREKIETDRHERAHWKSRKRTGDALPKQVQAVIETGKALVQEAKGLGRGR